MRIMIHDYAGHPFQAELSRKLATMGHNVDHVFFGADQGPKGAMSRQPGDPENIRFFSVDPGGAYSKTNFFRRRQGDLDYGKSVASLVRAECPDVVISGNTPTEAQDFIVRECVRSGIAFVYWCQDLYSIAATKLLERRLPGIGHVIGAYYRFLEGRQMRHSDLVINITDVFTEHEKSWGVPASRIEIIPNWGAIDQLPLTEKQNSWRKELGLSSGPIVLYSGTLALKHNPRLLIALAAKGRAQVVVLASGVGMEALHAAKAQEGLENLHLLSLQPFERFAEVLGSADVLLAVIEREAGEFSVPSKVLSYLCAGRPIFAQAGPSSLPPQQPTLPPR